MSLWRVDVGDVSHRLVDAESRELAIAEVVQSVIAALDLRAEPAPKSVQQLFAALGPRQARNFLAASDGLTDPKSTRTARSARRRLARELRFDMHVRAAAKAASGHPVDPERLAGLLRSSEIDRVQRAQMRLREFERDLYGGGQVNSPYGLD